eukprot:14881299-Ditylum_brightwellii.AAC.1
MPFCNGQQVLVKLDFNTLSWYTTNLAPIMQWIPATIAKVYDHNQTILCIVAQRPCNKHPILVGTWHDYYRLGFADVMPLEGDKAA